MRKPFRDAGVQCHGANPPLQGSRPSPLIRTIPAGDENLHGWRSHANRPSINFHATINSGALDDLIQVHNCRSLDAAESLWIKSPFKLSQRNVHKIRRAADVHLDIVIGAYKARNV